MAKIVKNRTLEKKEFEGEIEQVKTITDAAQKEQEKADAEEDALKKKQDEVNLK